MRISDWSSDVCSSDLSTATTPMDVVTAYGITVPPAHPDRWARDAPVMAGLLACGSLRPARPSRFPSGSVLGRRSPPTVAGAATVLVRPRRGFAAPCSLFSPVIPGDHHCRGL